MPEPEATVTTDEALRRALSALRDLRGRLDEAERDRDEPIAVIGMGCRFPGGVTSPDDLFELALEKRDAVGPIPDDRPNLREHFDPDPDVPNKMYTDQGGWIDKFDAYDAPFFGIAGPEADFVDPQHRMLLQLSWEALEDARIAPATLMNSRTGVYIGISTSDYAFTVEKSRANEPFGPYDGLGGAISMAAGRISHFYGLRGPSFVVDTACSSSLVAASSAVQSLQAGTSDLALAGGVNLILDEKSTVLLCVTQAISPKGRCHTFTDNADGYVRSEGGGIVVLKRLSDAQRDGDRIHAVIRSAAVNHDGHSSGLTVPSGPAQQEAMRAALDRVGFAATDVDYVEAHGTGTPLGDPIEVRAIDAVYTTGRSSDDPLLLGAIKPNVGHAEAAAGMAGLIKTVVSLERGEIAPHLLHGDLTPHLDWDGMDIELVTEHRRYPDRDRPSRAAVSAFGLSGTNGHIILEAPPAAPAPDGDRRGPHVVALAARDDTALSELATAYASALRDRPDELADLAYTAQTGRNRFPSRVAIAATDADEAAAAFDDFVSGAPDAATGRVAHADPAVGFMFTGQGSQMVGMGRDLYEHEPEFRAALDECAALLRSELSIELLEVVFEGPADLINDTTYTQPVLVALEYALARQWAAWGVRPSVVTGHSIGEYTAAILAGVFSLADGLRLAAARGRLMGALPAGGTMAAVLAPEEDVAQAIAGHPQVDLAAVNGPRASVIAGPESDIESIRAELESRGISVRPLIVSHAFHSPLMEPILDDFRRVAEGVTFSEPKLAYVSAVTGQRERALIASPDYWVRHVRATVRFADALDAFGADASMLLEVGPRPVLTGFAATVRTDLPALASMRPDRAELLHLRQTLGDLWTLGVEPDWPAVGDEPGRLVDAPGYPFQRRRQWREPVRRANTADRLHPLLHRRVLAPALHDIVYESVFATDDPAYLSDHRILGETVFPAAGYIEMMIAASNDAIGGGAVSVTGLRIHEMLALPEDTDVVVATTITEVDGVLRARVESVVDADAGTWRLHAEAVIELRTTLTDSAPVDLDELRSGTEPVTHDRYQTYAEIGFDYGPVFRGVREAFTRPGLTLARLDLDVRRSGDPHHVHPALIDGCFQAAGDAVELSEADSVDAVWVPVSIDRIDMPAAQPTSGWVQLTATVGDEEASFDFVLYDDDGAPCGRIDGLTSRRVPAETVWDQVGRARGDQGASLPHAHLLHETTWIELPALSPVGADGRWLVVGGDDRSEIIAEALRERGADARAATTLPTSPETYDGIVVITPDTGASAPGPVAAAAVADVHSACRALADPASAITVTGSVTVLTRGAHDVADQIPPVDPAQTAVAGYAVALAAELPTLRLRLIDTDPQHPLDPAPLATELLTPSAEGRIALRDEGRFGARLSALLTRDRHRLPDDAYQLELGERGSFDAIQFVDVEPPTPAADEVLIEVRASGLNFRDVLNVLGMYPGAPGVPGNECAGTVVAVGENVKDFSIGDDVVAMADGSFRRFAAAPQSLVYPLPPEVDHVAAATLPVTFLTAHYGFHDLARLQPGQTVLVHAGAGGVGLSALQLARRAGATVIATAGSPAKRSYLRSLGAAHVFDSRSLSFRDDVLAATDGRGVDVVLNSLADEFIPATLDCVADGGVFLEIGKRGVWTDEQMATARPDVAYHLYDLGEQLRAEPAHLGATMRQIIADVASGELQPLRRVTFPLAEVTSAFRYMAMARHVGKVVVTQSPADPTLGTYLVSGGHGALGLRTARELVERGVRHVALLSRRGPSPEAAADIDRLRALGAEVVSVAADVADHDGLAGALDDIRAAMPPIRGVIHAAGVLADGVVTNLDDAAFATVNGPKIDGAWNLHTLTATDPIERFVLFSSVAAQLGSPGQTNYAAANAFLDGLAHLRRQTGLPAISIAWGPWADIGMAAESNAANRGGVSGTIDPAAGVEILSATAEIGAPHLGVIPINWRRFGRTAGPGADNPFLELVVATPTGGPTSVDISSALAGLDSAEQLRTLADAVRQILADVLLVPVASIGDDQQFTELGLDSLLAVELSSRLERSVGRSVASTAALEFPTIQLLVDHLAGEVLDLQLGGGSDGVTTRPVRVDRADHIPASAAQSRILFIDEFQPGLSVYNLKTATKLTGALDLDAIQLAIDESVSRHEPLRTTFESIEGAYHQVVGPATSVPITVEDWRSDDDRSEERAIDRIQAFSSEPFDLASDLMLRMLVIRTGDEETYLALVLHHIAGDVWSLVQLFGEFGELYLAHTEGRPAELPDLPIQYIDYAHWFDASLEAGVFDDALAFWRDELAGELPVLSFPTDHDRPAERTYDGATLHAQVPPSTVEQVRTFSAGAGVTPFMTLYASYVTTMARYSGQDEIIVGTAHANRGLPETAPMVGFFANTVALRSSIDLDADFLTLTEQTKHTVIRATANQDAPFDRVVAEVNPPRDVTRPPIFQTMFLFSNMAMPAVELPGITGTFLDLDATAIDYDLGIELIDLDDHLRVRFRYNTGLFTEETIAQFTEHWLHLLDEATAAPTTPLGALPMAVEGTDPTAEWNDTAEAYDLDAKIHSLVTAQAQRLPEKIALRAGDQSLTYAELDRRSDHLARHLLDAGVGTEQFVGVVADRSAEMTVALLAVLKAGAGYLPLDPAYPADRLALMIDDSGADVIIDPNGQLSAVVDLSARTVIDPVGEAALIASNDGSVPPSDGDIAYIIYTSGSTGRPKGVVLEHRNVVNFLHTMRAEPGLSEDDTLLAVTTLSFDISVLELFLPLTTGATVVMATPDEVADGTKLAAAIEASGATVMQATPVTWTMLFDAGWAGQPDLRVLSGGEALSRFLADRLLANGGEVWNMFGPTETTVWSTIHRVEPGTAPVPIGRPIANTICRVVEPSGAIAPIGVPGELLIGGAGVARGYHDRPDVNAERFIADPTDPTQRLYRTGDLARWRRDGTIEFLGRLDHQVKVRGHRIELGEIEASLRRAAGVRDAVVVTHGTGNSTRLVAYLIAADPDAEPSTVALREHLQQSLPDYMIPSIFAVVDEFPLTPNRKIDRRALPPIEGLEQTSTVPFVEPESDAEAAIAMMFADVLEYEPVGAIDNFFERGGHSLQATALIARLTSVFGWDIGLRAFVTDPTPRAVLGALATLDGDRARIEQIGQIERQVLSLTLAEDTDTETNG